MWIWFLHAQHVKLLRCPYGPARRGDPVSRSLPQPSKNPCSRYGKHSKGEKRERCNASTQAKRQAGPPQDPSLCTQTLPGRRVPPSARRSPTAHPAPPLRGEFNSLPAGSLTLLCSEARNYKIYRKKNGTALQLHRGGLCGSAQSHPPRPGSGFQPGPCTRDALDGSAGAPNLLQSCTKQEDPRDPRCLHLSQPKGQEQPGRGAKLRRVVGTTSAQGSADESRRKKVSPEGVDGLSPPGSVNRRKNH